MGRLRFTEDFRIDAVKQITERGYAVGDFLHLYEFAWQRRLCRCAETIAHRAVVVIPEGFVQASQAGCRPKRIF